MVVWLGYSVHGNETSSGEAAMLTAYYLVANRSAETQQWLQQARSQPTQSAAYVFLACVGLQIYASRTGLLG